MEETRWESRVPTAIAAKHKKFRIAVCIMACGFLSACSNDTRLMSFAPSPPPIPREDITTVEMGRVSPAEASVYDVEPAAGSAGVLQKWDVPAEAAPELGFEQQKVPTECRLHDRFDRKALLAYEWGDNRLGFNVQGLNMAGGKVDGTMLSYRLRFSPDERVAYKTKRERCRYQSGWQGLIGSGYHEFFVRENDTVMQGLRDMRRDVEDRF